MNSRWIGVVIAVAGCWLGTTAVAGPRSLEFGGKLLLTRGITSLDGAGGGGITPWALITGNGTDRGVGATFHGTVVALPDYEVRNYGAAVGWKDRIEFSFQRQEFDTGDTGPLLGLPQDFTFRQDIVGAKVRLAGDAVYDQNSPMPQISIGTLYKRAEHPALLTALGADDHEGVEVYASATKLLLAQSLLLNGTLRYTEANQNGLLGFGGGDGAAIYPEGSAAVMLSRRLIVGAEYRMMPDNLAFAEQDNWGDVFAAYALNEHLTFTAAYADLGSIATFKEQRGVYVQIQSGW